MQHIHQFCQSRGWSQARLARELGISSQRLSAYASGKRHWPQPVMEALRELTGEPATPIAEWFLPWGAHQRLAQNRRWEAVVDPGSTWANGPSRYGDVYRQLKPRRTPPDSFRRLIRVDSQLESLAYAQLCEDGANPFIASPTLLGFRSHFLVDHQILPIGTQYRACLTGLFENLQWILWPQLTVWLPDGTLRPDGLVMIHRKGRTAWGYVQLDGAPHLDKAYDARQDLRLQPLPSFRYPSTCILGLQFPSLFREDLKKWAT